MKTQQKFYPIAISLVFFFLLLFFFGENVLN